MRIARNLQKPLASLARLGQLICPPIAYLSTDDVNARDRIGTGPWVNYSGVTVATDVDNLHDAAANALSKENSISESGSLINGRGDTPNMHDILTGSDAMGMSTGASCAAWTSNAEGSARGSPRPHRRWR